MSKPLSNQFLPIYGNFGAKIGSNGAKRASEGQNMKNYFKNLSNHETTQGGEVFMAGTWARFFILLEND